MSDIVKDVAGLGGWPHRKDGLFMVKKFGHILRRATETGVPNLRCGEPVARMPSAGITNLRQASAFLVSNVF
jgi:hypothetical protein